MIGVLGSIGKKLGGFFKSKDDMKNIAVFNNTHKGASHYKSGLPCQVSSTSYAAEDGSLYVSIVCDGHGGTTYVRSDRGSKLAASITLEAIKNFVSKIDSSLFIGKEGAVTARPDNDDDGLFGTSKSNNKIKDSDLSESQLQLKKQNEDYAKQVENIKEQDKALFNLFAYIYETWLSAVQDDANENPFSEEELTKLGGKRVVKAYGSTLIAFVRTKLYWFAFHIGDGKCIAFDYNLKWREPIPWDCNCFLNICTSLCASNPIPSFRYCFNGTGSFPAAVIMGSDGLDDSWVTMENLTKFYTQILSIASTSGMDSLKSELDDYLPKLSTKGSRDDMSVAGVIDLDAIKGGLKLQELRSAVAKLTMERQSHIEQQNSVLDRLKQATSALSDISKQKQEIIEAHNSLFAIFTKKKKGLEDKNDELEKNSLKLSKQVEELKVELDSVKRLCESESQRIGAEIENLKVQTKEIESENTKKIEQDLKMWQELEQELQEQSSEKLQQSRQDQAESMKENSDNWSAAIIEEDSKDSSNNEEKLMM